MGDAEELCKGWLKRDTLEQRGPVRDLTIISGQFTFRTPVPFNTLRYLCNLTRKGAKIRLVNRWDSSSLYGDDLSNLLLHLRR